MDPLGEMRILAKRNWIWLDIVALKVKCYKNEMQCKGLEYCNAANIFFKVYIFDFVEFHDIISNTELNLYNLFRFMIHASESQIYGNQIFLLIFIVSSFNIFSEYCF